jgi:cytochrome P450
MYITVSTLPPPPAWARQQLRDMFSELRMYTDSMHITIHVCHHHPRACRARQQLRDIFAKIIQARRASGRREEDVLQQFIDGR